MTFLLSCLDLFFTFLKIGILGFGGGYAMMSMIMMECEKYSITTAQFADLNALDMVVPGPIAINAATYVGYLHSGFWGAFAATIGVSLPSFLIVSLVLHFISKYRENTIMNGAMSGIKPAAVGLIAVVALKIAFEVLSKPGADAMSVFTDPMGTISFLMVAVFFVTAVANIRFKVNPILLTVLAGVVGAILS
ncbi:MAG: chromate transporter [Oscillospiraceae bacterium]|nr:chromate transporter [Oscillospiraceae bacterium]